MSVHTRIFTAALLTGTMAVPAPGNSIDEAGVLRAERQFGAAVAANDARGIAHVTTEDWRIIDSDGHIIPRAAFLQIIASGTLQHTGLSNSAATVRIYGNAAIVTAHSKSAGMYAGSAFSTDEVSTDVWVRKNNHWRCVLTQLTTRKP